MKKNLLIQALALLGAIWLGCSSAMADEAKLVITTITGWRATFPLADDPVITFQDNVLEVSGKNLVLTVDADQVWTFDFIPSSGAGVDEINVGDSQLSGLKPGTPVEVYTFDGKLAGAFKADDSQTVNVKLSELAPGFYIIRTPETSFKIKKN